MADDVLFDDFNFVFISFNQFLTIIVDFIVNFADQGWIGDQILTSIAGFVQAVLEIAILFRTDVLNIDACVCIFIDNRKFHRSFFGQPTSFFTINDRTWIKSNSFDPGVNFCLIVTANEFAFSQQGSQHSMSRFSHIVENGQKTFGP